eukprot:725617-Pyramimonas_sp.AAC.1
MRRVLVAGSCAAICDQQLFEVRDAALLQASHSENAWESQGVHQGYWFQTLVTLVTLGFGAVFSCPGFSSTDVTTLQVLTIAILLKFIMHRSFTVTQGIQNEGHAHTKLCRISLLVIVEASGNLQKSVGFLYPSSLCARVSYAVGGAPFAHPWDNRKPIGLFLCHGAGHRRGNQLGRLYVHLHVGVYPIVMFRTTCVVAETNMSAPPLGRSWQSTGGS